MVEPSDASGLDAYVRMARQKNLTTPRGIIPTGCLGRIGHAEMANGDTQAGTSSDDILQLGYLTVAVGQGDGEKHVVGFHETEHLQHRLTVQRTPEKPVAGNGHAAKATDGDQVGGLFQKIVGQIVGHAADQETVGVAAGYVGQIVVLQTVDELLHHDGSRDLGIVHVGEENLGRVAPVDHERGKHLHLLAQKQGTAIRRSADDLLVPSRVLPQPEMAVGIDNQEFFHLTNIWSPMMRCTSFTN